MIKKVRLKPITIDDMHFLAQYAAICDGISNRMKIIAIEQRLKKRFKNENYLGVIAFIDKERVGFQDGIIKNGNLELNEIYVCEKYRGLCIGTKLLKKMLLYSKAKSIKRVIFITEPDNKPMIKLAKRIHFNLSGLIYEKGL